MAGNLSKKFRIRKLSMKEDIMYNIQKMNYKNPQDM